ncbi:MAG TPA: hypothetical protein VGJ44_22145 [Kribbellaceae bacterium]
MNLHRLTSAAAGAALAAGLTTTPVASASTADCGLADLKLTVPAPEMTWIGPPQYDGLAITPTAPHYQLTAGLGCTSEHPAVRVERLDGSAAHRVELDAFVESPDVSGWFGLDVLPYVTGTGRWRILTAYEGTTSATLTHPVYFTVKRATTVTLSIPSAYAPAKPVASGVVKYWNYQGQLVASPGRRVDIRLQDAGSGTGKVIASTTTDSYGRYAVALPLTKTTSVYAAVPSTSTLGWVTSHAGARDTVAKVLHRTSISGTVRPTYAAVVHPGTLMSTWGHLTVVTSSGAVIPYAGQKVVVQTRPRGDTTKAYRTVGAATTNSNGYFYTNWDASSDADVRVAFLSPYQSVTSSYRWIGAVDVS